MARPRFDARTRSASAVCHRQPAKPKCRVAKGRALAAWRLAAIAGYLAVTTAMSAAILSIPYVGPTQLKELPASAENSQEFKMQLNSAFKEVRMGLLLNASFFEGPLKIAEEQVFPFYQKVSYGKYYADMIREARKAILSEDTNTHLKQYNALKALAQGLQGLNIRLAYASEKDPSLRAVYEALTGVEKEIAPQIIKMRLRY